MNENVRRILNHVREAADFCYVVFNDVNDTNALGENALHCVCTRGDFEAVIALVDAGIDLNRPGEFGETPLARAELFGFQQIADFLRTRGAISIRPDFDDPSRRERHDVHLKKLAETIEELRGEIRRQCGDVDEDQSS